MTLLAVQSLAVHYGAVAGVRDVSLDVNAGEIVALLGANGAGKTTTLRAISGLVKVRSGRIAFESRGLSPLQPDAIARLGVAHVPAGRGIFPTLSVVDNLRMAEFGASHGPTVPLQDVMRQFPVLGEKRNQLAGELSGGQQQQLAIARALVQKPRLLLLDEMSMGLSPAVVAELFSVIEGLRQDGVAVLMVEQFVTEALRVADRAVVLEQGRVVASGTSREIGASDVVGAYLGHGSGDIAVGGAPPSARESYTVSLPGPTVRILEAIAAEREEPLDELITTAVRGLVGAEPGGAAAETAGSRVIAETDHRTPEAAGRSARTHPEGNMSFAAGHVGELETQRGMADTARPAFDRTVAAAEDSVIRPSAREAVEMEAGASVDGLINAAVARLTRNR